MNADPTQQQIDLAIRDATRLRVREVLGGGTLLEVEDADAVASFAALLRIRPGEPFHCMCPGDQTLEFLGYGRLRRTAITLHHGRSLRWDDAWDTDVLLEDPASVLGWLADRGVTGPRDDAERVARDERRSREEWEAWKRAAPVCLAPILDELSALGGVPPDVDEPLHLRAVGEVGSALPDERQAILALLEWFGSGEGPWSGFPSYEAIPEWLLHRYSTEAIVAALEDRSTTRQLEGGARLLASWWFGRLRPGDAAGIPTLLADRMLAHVEASRDEDRRARLRHALVVRP